MGEHFNGPGHSLADMKILALEKVFTPGKQIIEKRESFYINKLEAEFKGLNKKKLLKLFIFCPEDPSLVQQLFVCITPDDVIVIITNCIVYLYSSSLYFYFIL